MVMESTGDTMVIGTVEATRRNVQGKKLVSTMFTGAGYRVMDIGEDTPVSEFVKAAQELKATIVGASAIGSLKPQCRVLHDALIEAGIRDDVIYIVGSWGITEEWCDGVEADAFGENAVDTPGKVKALLSGDLPGWRDRVKRSAAPPHGSASATGWQSRPSSAITRMRTVGRR
jgi:methanogenic corrinoid protein MtbC1